MSVILPKEFCIVTPITAETTAHFSSTPWCKPFLTNPELQPFIPTWRDPKQLRGNTFMGITLNSDETIRELQNLYAAPSSNRPFGEIIHLISIGVHVNGHVNTSHGGFVGVLLDDMVGCSVKVATCREIAMTAYLNIVYKKPVGTPGVVLGRKLFRKAVLEDGLGMVYATADALFIVVGLKPEEKI